MILFPINFLDMSQKYKQRKSNRVLLTRSGNKPDGKEIQGLVFDHPSMPKIVTITSGLTKKSPRGNTSTGLRPREEHNPSGEKYPNGEKYPAGENDSSPGKYPIGHRTTEQHTTGHFTRQRSATERSAAHPTNTVHYTPRQYPTAHQTSAQYPTRSSPPALIHTSNQYSGRQQIQANPNQFNAGTSADRFAGISRAEIPFQAEHSQTGYSLYHRNGPSSGNALPAASVAAAHNTQFQYAQHVTDSQRTQEAALRRNSTGTLRHHSENGVQRRQNEVQLRENVGQHRNNIGQRTIDLGSSAFSHDFHLNVWRESHARAVREWNSSPQGQDHPAREQDRPIRRLDHHPHLPMTTGHYVNGHAARYRSLSASAGVQPKSVFRGEMPDSLHAQHSCSKPTVPHASSNPPPMTRQYGSNVDTRRYSTGRVAVPNGDVSTIEANNSPEVWTSKDYCPRVQNAEGTYPRGSDVSGRRDSISTDGYNPVVRSAEETNARISSADGVRRLSNNMEEYDPAVRNSQALNSVHHKIPSIINEDYNPVVQNAEERELGVRNSGNVRKSSSPLQEPSHNPQQHEKPRTNNRRRQKCQQTPTVVVISDSEDEEDKELPPVNWNDDSDQDVFTVEPACDEGENVGCASPSSSESGCIITKVTRHETQKDTEATKSRAYDGESRDYDEASCGHDGESRVNDTNSHAHDEESGAYDGKSGVIDEESRAFDVNNNERRENVRTIRKQSRESMESSSKGVGTTYRSVLYEQVAEQSGTKRVVISEQMLFNKDNRGTKRHLEGDDNLYFVAGAAEMAGSSLDRAERKIRRVLCSEVEVSERDRVASVKTATGNYEHLSKLLRSRSENDEQVGRRNTNNVRSGSLTFEPGTPESASSQSDDSIVSSEFVKKLERAIERRFSSKTPRETKLHCYVCEDGTVRVSESLPEPETSGIVSREEIRCRRGDGVPDECQNPGNENGLTVVKLQKNGPKPTGIVVGIKQQVPEAKEPLESETTGSGNEMKKMLQSKTDALQKKLLQLPTCNTTGSEKLAKSCSTTRDVMQEEDDVMDEHDLDLLHFNVVRKDANVEGHVKRRTNSREQVSSSQQWEAYSLKLEQERLAAMDCTEKSNEAVKRNSWQELKRKLAVEGDTFTESQRQTSERSNATRKRAYSCENVLYNSFPRRYKFHDTTKRFSQENAMGKLSKESRSETLPSPNCSNTESDSKGYNCESNTSKSQAQITTSRSELPAVSNSSNPEKDFPKSPTSDKRRTEIVPPKTYSPSEEKPFELNHHVNDTNEFKHSNVKISETAVQTKKSSYEIASSDIGPSEERTPEVETRENSSYEIPPSVLRPHEVKPTSPSQERQGRKSPQKEVYSIKEWTEILQGRIAQVRESIEEETTPWKTKNKKKVLEKLENHLAWLTGPAMDESIFVSRKLQFFQTMKKQYELMNKIKNQRQTMKCSDGTTHPAAENEEKSKEKAAKEVEVSKQTKEVKKTVKYKPKR